MIIPDVPPSPKLRRSRTCIAGLDERRATHYAVDRTQSCGTRWNLSAFESFILDTSLAWRPASARHSCCRLRYECNSPHLLSNGSIPRRSTDSFSFWVPNITITDRDELVKLVKRSCYLRLTMPMPSHSRSFSDAELNPSLAQSHTQKVHECMHARSEGARRSVRATTTGVLCGTSREWRGAGVPGRLCLLPPAHHTSVCKTDESDRPWTSSSKREARSLYVAR